MGGRLLSMGGRVPPRPPYNLSTSCITTKRITTLLNPAPRHCARETQLIRSFEEILQRWKDVGNTVSDLTSLRFEHQTSRSRDERVTARPTKKFLIWQ